MAEDRQWRRLVVSIDPVAEAALGYLRERTGLRSAALVRLALRRLAEAEGWRPAGGPARRPRVRPPQER